MRADDSAFVEGRGCYTSARVEAGRPRFAERHVARLVRAAPGLGLGEVDPEWVRRALSELAEAAFAGGDGVVRLQLSRDGAGIHLVGTPRALGHERSSWRAIRVGLPHPGAGLAEGYKVSSRLTMALAGDAADAAGVEEALLVDGGGRLVEGARSNIVVVADGRGPATPPLAAGAVAGIARSVVMERVAELEEREIPAAELTDAVEIIALNAVRGACPVVLLDGAPVGDGAPGPWAEQLARALERD